MPDGFWTPTHREPPPKDGQFWAWLHDHDVRRLTWRGDAFHDRFGEAFTPEYWARLGAIPNPQELADHG